MAQCRRRYSSMQEERWLNVGGDVAQWRRGEVVQLRRSGGLMVAHRTRYSSSRFVFDYCPAYFKLCQSQGGFQLGGHSTRFPTGRQEAPSHAFLLAILLRFMAEK
jgi:hypothetical protein